MPISKNVIPTKDHWCSQCHFSKFAWLRSIPLTEFSTGLLGLLTVMWFVCWSLHAGTLVGTGKATDSGSILAHFGVNGSVSDRSAQLNKVSCFALCHFAITPQKYSPHMHLTTVLQTKRVHFLKFWFQLLNPFFHTQIIIKASKNSFGEVFSKFVFPYI